MPAIDTIAVGFDGSPDAVGAIGWALELAAALGAEVAVVHGTGLLEHASASAGVADLERRVRLLAADRGLEPDRLRWYALDGDPCSVLLRSTSAPIGADLIVVGSRGTGAHSETLLGSTSHELAERATCPLVIVPRSDPA